MRSKNVDYLSTLINAIDQFQEQTAGRTPTRGQLALHQRVKPLDRIAVLYR